MLRMDIWDVFSWETAGSYSFLAKNSRRKMTWVKEWRLCQEADTVVDVF